MWGEDKGGGGKVCAFVVSNLSTIGKITVLEQGVEGDPESWYME